MATPTSDWTSWSWNCCSATPPASSGVTTERPALFCRTSHFSKPAFGLEPKTASLQVAHLQGFCCGYGLLSLVKGRLGSRRSADERSGSPLEDRAVVRREERRGKKMNRRRRGRRRGGPGWARVLVR